jgi:hypothetical protein
MGGWRMNYTLFFNAQFMMRLENGIPPFSNSRVRIGMIS